MAPAPQLRPVLPLSPQSPGIRRGGQARARNDRRGGNKKSLGPRRCPEVLGWTQQPFLARRCSPKRSIGEASAPAFAHPQAAWGTEGLTGASTGSLGFKGRADPTPGSAASLLSPLQALSPCSAHKPHPCSQARRLATRTVDLSSSGRQRAAGSSSPAWVPSFPDPLSPGVLPYGLPRTPGSPHRSSLTGSHLGFSAQTGPRVGAEAGPRPTRASPGELDSKDRGCCM